MDSTPKLPPKLRFNRFSLASFATVFNIIFEYSIRGFEGFEKQPGLVFVFFLFYFTYFLMLEDLIVRYAFHEYQVLLTGFFFGLFYSVLATGIVFVPDGIDWVALVYIQIFWWGFLQSHLALYFSNRIRSRIWNHPRMGGTGWTLSISIQAIILMLISVDPLVTRGPGWAYIVMIAINTIVFIIIAVSVYRDKGRPRKFNPSRLLDVLSLGYLILFLISGSLLVVENGIKAGTSLYNLTVSAVTVSVLILGMILMILIVYYRKKGKEIPF